MLGFSALSETALSELPLSGNFAIGFRATNFGTPQLNSYLVTGFSVTHFGTPLESITHMVTALGPVTNFGLAHSGSWQTSTVSGFITGSFGTPIMAMAFSGVAGGWNPTRFGRPAVPTARTLQASGSVVTVFGLAACPPPLYGVVDGFSVTFFGTPHQVVSHTGVASGFVVTAFGDPHLPVPQTAHASGFLAAQYGSPGSAEEGVGPGYCKVSAAAPSTNFGNPLVPATAKGFLTTQFGLAMNELQAAGFMPTVFGTPSRLVHWIAAPLDPVARFGIPSTPTNRAAQASGFVHTAIGDPVALRFVRPVLSRIELASGFKASHVGAPSAAMQATPAATGFASSAFGSPSSSVTPRCAASAVAPDAAFGSPVAMDTAHPSGWRSAVVGTPSTGINQPATGLYRAPRFGTAASTRSNTYFPSAIWPRARFGQPRAFNRFRYQAAGFTSSNLGSPACIERHRVTMTAPATRFGTSKVVRNTECITTAFAVSFGPTEQLGQPTRT